MTKPVLITRDTLRQKAEHANRKERFYLDEEELEYLEYHPVFSKSKRVLLLQELFETVQDCNEKQIPFFTNEMEIIKYIEFLMLKHFTDVSKMLIDVDFEGHIEVMKDLTDLEFIQVFVNEVFDVDQVSKVYNEYYLAKDRLNNYLIELERQTKIGQNVAQKKVSNQKFKEIATKAVK